MGLELKGETSDCIWGVCDFIADTDFQVSGHQKPMCSTLLGRLRHDHSSRAHRDRRVPHTTVRPNFRGRRSGRPQRRIRCERCKPGKAQGFYTGLLSTSLNKQTQSLLPTRSQSRKPQQPQLQTGRLHIRSQTGGLHIRSVRECRTSFP
jgi:hypothetical protein